MSKLEDAVKGMVKADITYHKKLDVLEEALRNKDDKIVLFVHTPEREYELHDVSYVKQLDQNGFIQTVITLEVR